jgi:hypothetical protein
VVCGPDLHAVLHQLSLEAARSATGLVPLHAAAVERDGRVVALAGPSGSGKSTLCAAAVHGGYRYVADEVLAVDPSSLEVRVFHRPIGLRRGGADLLGVEHDLDREGCVDSVHPWMPEPAQLSGGGTLTAIGIVSRTFGAVALEPISPPAALAVLAQHTVIPDDDLADAFSGLTSIVRAVPVSRLHYDTLADGVCLIGELRTGSFAPPPGLDSN